MMPYQAGFREIKQEIGSAETQTRTAEAVNAGLYLVPRLAPEQLADAIVGYRQPNVIF